MTKYRGLQKDITNILLHTSGLKPGSFGSYFVCIKSVWLAIGFCIESHASIMASDPYQSSELNTLDCDDGNVSFDSQDI